MQDNFDLRSYLSNNPLLEDKIKLQRLPHPIPSSKIPSQSYILNFNGNKIPFFYSEHRNFQIYFSEKNELYKKFKNYLKQQNIPFKENHSRTDGWFAFIIFSPEKYFEFEFN